MNINTYDEVTGAEFYNKPIRIECIVTGKSLTPYQIPKVVVIKCTSEDCEGKCHYSVEQSIQMNPIDQDILKFIDIPSIKIASVLKQVIGIACKSIKYEVIETQLIERIFVARPTGKERTRKGGGSRPAYLIGATIESNTVYHLEGYTTVDPVTQGVTHVFTSVDKQTNDIESFNLSTNKHSELNEFCVSKNDTFEMFSKLKTLYTNYAHNITKIYEREDLHMCVDMLFRSVISFRFDNEFVKKGWMEMMVVGDTRCGKGYVAEKLLEYYGVGEVVNGENCSFAGLVQQTIPARRYFDFPAIADHRRRWGHQIEERSQRVRRSPTRLHFHPMPEQDEGDQHHRSIEEGLAKVAHRYDDTETIGSEYARRDQDAHVQRAMTQRPRSAGNKNPATTEDDRRCKDEQ